MLFECRGTLSTFLLLKCESPAKANSEVMIHCWGCFPKYLSSGKQTASQRALIYSLIGELANLTTKIITLSELFSFVNSEFSRLQYE
jgi:hypothetical protein